MSNQPESLKYNQSIITHSGCRYAFIQVFKQKNLYHNHREGGCGDF